MDGLIAEARSKFGAVLRSAGYDLVDVGPLETERLPTVGHVVKFNVENIMQHGPPPSPQRWHYVGYHATDMEGLRGILRSGGIQRLPPHEGGSDLCLFHADLAPRAARRMELLIKAFTSSLGSSGVVCMATNNCEHPVETVRYGGHAEEAATSRGGRITRYRGNARWSFPPETTTIHEVFLLPAVFARLDVEAAVAAAAFV